MMIKIKIEMDIVLFYTFNKIFESILSQYYGHCLVIFVYIYIIICICVNNFIHGSCGNVHL